MIVILMVKDDVDNQEILGHIDQKPFHAIRHKPTNTMRCFSFSLTAAMEDAISLAVKDYLYLSPNESTITNVGGVSPVLEAKQEIPERQQEIPVASKDGDKWNIMASSGWKFVKNIGKWFEGRTVDISHLSGCIVAFYSHNPSYAGVFRKPDTEIVSPPQPPVTTVKNGRKRKIRRGSIISKKNPNFTARLFIPLKRTTTIPSHLIVLLDHTYLEPSERDLEYIRQQERDPTTPLGRFRGCCPKA